MVAKSHTKSHGTLTSGLAANSGLKRSSMKAMKSHSTLSAPRHDHNFLSGRKICTCHCRYQRKKCVGVDGKATRGYQHLFESETSWFNNLTWAWWRPLPSGGERGGEGALCTACSRKCSAPVVLGMRLKPQLEGSTARSASSPAKNKPCTCHRLCRRRARPLLLRPCLHE